MKSWAKTNIIYQIYPRSFQDSNGDGVGDIVGIIDRLRYLKGSVGALGVDAIWLSPIYASPMKDCGYDVSDYRSIDPVFGTMDEFKKLLSEAHRRGIRVMMDLVPNHTSDQHEWFKEARRSRDSSKRDYYIWRDGKADGSPPNNWSSLAGGSMWHFDEISGQYYLHSFLQEQPDLNWQNPAVRKEIQDVMRFWFDLGVDGFRVDAVWKLSKDPELRDNPLNDGYGGAWNDYGATIHTNSKNGPHLAKYLRAMTDVATEYTDKLLIFEYYPDMQPHFGTIFEQYRKLYDVNSAVARPLCMELINKPWNAVAFREFTAHMQSTLKDGELPAYCVSNHDQSRIVSRWGVEQARIVAMLLMTLPGIPTVYYGDELGMEDASVSAGFRNDQFDDDSVMGGRDPERTPMQWDRTDSAGFTTGRPWLPVPKSSLNHNVATEFHDPSSILTLYRRLLALRSSGEVWNHGDFTLIESVDDIMAFGRHLHNERYIVLLNFSGVEHTVFASYVGKAILGTNPSHPPHLQANGEITLRAHEGVIIKI